VAAAVARRAGKDVTDTPGGGRTRGHGRGASGAGGRAAFPLWLTAYAFAVVMVGTTLPTPLYPFYEQRWGFSPLVITVIFAVYAVGVIAALLFLGSVSDRIGRRPALLAGLALSALSAVAFLLAGGLGALLAGRALSGLSAGIVTGAGTAALVDLAPPGRQSFASGVATAANLGGLGCGALLAGVVAALAAAPLRLPFWTDLALLAPAFMAVTRVPETVRPSGGEVVHMQRLRVPAALRGTFTRAATAGFASFAMSGLFSAVAPTFLARLLHQPSPALAGAMVFALFTASAAGQLAIGRMPARTGLSTGCIGVAIGAGLVAGALALGSLLFLIAGAVVAGLGQGLSVGAGLAALNTEAPPNRRGEVASSYFVVLYVALSIPIVGVGLAAQIIGLRLAALIFTAFVAALAATCLISLLARRPTRKRRHRPRQQASPQERQ
jgi:MFS family permease